jgi:hypothetical protein
MRRITRLVFNVLLTNKSTISIQMDMSLCYFYSLDVHITKSEEKKRKEKKYGKLVYMQLWERYHDCRCLVICRRIKKDRSLRTEKNGENILA